MTAFPVLARECQAEARRRTNYWLRAFGAAFMVFIFMGLVRHDVTSAARLGSQLFPQFHTILLLSVLVIAPLLTADCLAREKREGTLPLLLLTNLTPGGIISAKMFAHASRGLALVLASLPVLCMPFVLGGVSPAETLISTLLCLSALFLGLAAGVLASSATQSATRAIILGIALSLSLNVTAALVYTLTFGYWLEPLTWSPIPGATPHFGVWELLVDNDRYWGKAIAHFPDGGQQAWLALVKTGFGMSALIAVLLLLFSGRLVRWSGVERSPSQLAKQGIARWWIPQFWRHSMRRRQRHHLRENPIYWLQQRTWSARMAMWGWIGFVALAEAVLLFANGHIWSLGQFLVGLALIFGIIYAAASSYRLERLNGMLEMILVTPVRAWKLVSGRVHWLWRQFFPALFLWEFAAHMTAPKGFDVDGLLQFNAFAATVWLVTPVVGLDCAINFRGIWRPLIATGAAVLLVPGAIFLYRVSAGWSAALLCCLVLWIVGLLTTFGLELQMRERRFRYLHPHIARRHRSRRKSRSRSRAPALVTLSARLR